LTRRDEAGRQPPHRFVQPQPPQRSWGEWTVAVVRSHDLHGVPAGLEGNARTASLPRRLPDMRHHKRRAF
jgi:hypothetical protein